MTEGLTITNDLQSQPAKRYSRPRKAGGLCLPKPDLELLRVSITSDGAFGVLLIDGVPAGPVSLERTYPVAESTPHGPQFVKIPPGDYDCTRTRFWRGGGVETFEITGVVGHSRLLFHSGNQELDSDGCVLLGQRFGLFKGRPAVLESRLAFGTFMSWFGGRNKWRLRVRNS